MPFVPADAVDQFEYGVTRPLQRLEEVRVALIDPDLPADADFLVLVVVAVVALVIEAATLMVVVVVAAATAAVEAAALVVLVVVALGGPESHRKLKEIGLKPLKNLS